MQAVGPLVACVLLSRPWVAPAPADTFLRPRSFKWPLSSNRSTTWQSSVSPLRHRTTRLYVLVYSRARTASCSSDVARLTDRRGGLGRPMLAPRRHPAALPLAVIVLTCPKDGRFPWHRLVLQSLHHRGFEHCPRSLDSRTGGYVQPVSDFCELAGMDGATGSTSGETSYTVNVS